MNAWTYGILATFLAWAFWMDVRYMRIPNRLTIGFGAAGLAFQTVHGGGSGLAEAAAGCAAGLLPMLLLYRMRGIGAGDVKWFGAYGAWSGAAPALQLQVYSLLSAGVIAFGLLLLRLPVVKRIASRLPWPWGTHPALAGGRTEFPFMLAVLPGFAWWIFQSGFRLA